MPIFKIDKNSEFCSFDTGKKSTGRDDTVKPIYSRNIAIYRCLIRRFSRARMCTVEGWRMPKSTGHRKAKINPVASSINASGTPAISRNGGTKGHNAHQKSNERSTDPLITHSR